MNASKAIPKDTIPGKIVQNNSDIMTDILSNNFNNSIYSSEFPNNLKLADVSPIYKDEVAGHHCQREPRPAGTSASGRPRQGA